MPIIKELPDHLINKIAAGEVVERPSNVVKELVENSIDAQSTKISIDILEGGRKGIIVKDNGLGMSPDQLKLAVHRHTTSKIASVDDLFNIRSFGFRGEALASIAAVSKMTVKSKERDSKAPGYVLKMDGGTITEEGEIGFPEGTMIDVRYLFYQTPARLKFLKRAETEITHINDYVTRAALSHPEIGFTLTHNGRKSINCNATDSYKKRLLDILGKDMAEAAYPVELELDGIKVTGLIGHPHVNRGHNRNLYVFVNARPVKDKLLYHAIMEGYRDTLMRGRFPFVVLFIDIDPEFVDVNVHPAKAEVRFSNSQVVHRIVYEAVRTKLTEQPWKDMTDGVENAPIYDVPVSFQSSRGADQKARTSETFSISYDRSIKPTFQSPKPSSSFADDNQALMALKKQVDKPIQHELDYLKTTSCDQRTGGFPGFKGERQFDYLKMPYGELNVLAQLMNTYILCECRGKLVLVDQHAAHERIGYEKLLIQHKEGHIDVQNLLIPENFDLQPTETELLKKVLDDMGSFGIEIDYFGGNTFILRAMPVLLKLKEGIYSFIQDLIGDAFESGQLSSLKDKMNHVYATMSCHAAIRAGDPLEFPEMTSLLKELDQYQFTSFCPHGRPAAIEVKQTEIERWFKRVL